MTEPLRWGVLGTGKIAHKFASELQQTESGHLVAVGSRTPASANGFVEEFGGRAVGDYQALLNDKEVEAVYLSLPNSLHYPWTLLGLQAGKHILCEKPIASTAAEAEEMFELAQKSDRRLVEAFMYRQHPAVQQMLADAHSGLIGQVKMVRAHFTYHRPPSMTDVRYQPKLAGGSIMDVGCYCVNFARAATQSEPTDVQVSVHRHEGGVDEYAAGVLNFNGKMLASFSCGMTVEADRRTLICGDQGYLWSPDPWLGGDCYYRVINGKEEQVQAAAAYGRYALEADEMARLIREGGDPIVTPADTIGNMHVLDELRMNAGLGY